MFALKVLKKVDGMVFAFCEAMNAICSPLAVIKLKQVEHVRNERNVLAAVAGYPLITTLVTSFSDDTSLYMLVCSVS